MEHKDVQAEIVKVCEKCGFSGFPHSVRHRPSLYRGAYRGEAIITPEYMVFTCSRCGYEWEIEVT